jgi:hypothetical protein
MKKTNDGAEQSRQEGQWVQAIGWVFAHLNARASAERLKKHLLVA